jgi:hypothetical protein
MSRAMSVSDDLLDEVVTKSRNEVEGSPSSRSRICNNPQDDVSRRVMYERGSST